MAVRIRMKRMGRAHRPFYRICATDARSAHDGRVIEELGFYDPMVKETDARARLNSDRIDYWISVGAQPSEKVSVLIKKYGSNGTHLEQQQAAFARLAMPPQLPVLQKIELPQPAPPESDREAATEEASADVEVVEATEDASNEEASTEEPTAEV